MRKADEAQELDALRREVDELRASRRRLALADAAEHRRIERTLHDDIQQQLVGLAAGLELATGSIDADPREAERILAGLEQEVRATLEAARTLAHRISPPLLEAGGLVPALRTAAAAADVPTRIDVGTGAASPPEIAGTVYRCCLQVLERASGDTPVSVIVRDDERALTFEIAADVDLDEADRLDLRDRVEALGGRLDVSSEPERGTRVVGSVPRSG